MIKTRKILVSIVIGLLPIVGFFLDGYIVDSVLVMFVCCVCLSAVSLSVMDEQLFDSIDQKVNARLVALTGALGLCVFIAAIIYDKMP